VQLPSRYRRLLIPQPRVVALMPGQSRMLADLYVRREYTGDLRIRVKLDNGERYIITIKEE
jgi:hypothetical protein